MYVYIESNCILHASLTYMYYDLRGQNMFKHSLGGIWCPKEMLVNLNNHYFLTEKYNGLSKKKVIIYFKIFLTK